MNEACALESSYATVYAKKDASSGKSTGNIRVATALSQLLDPRLHMPVQGNLSKQGRMNEVTSQRTTLPPPLRVLQK